MDKTIIYAEMRTLIKNKKNQTRMVKRRCVSMEQALDPKECFIVRDFFRKILRTADLAAKNNTSITETTISRLMIMYRNKAI